MKNKLLSTTALIGLVSFISSPVLADVSITGGMEFTYTSQDKGDAAVNGASDDYFSSDQEVLLAFTKKTDSGLTIGMYADLESSGTEAVSSLNSDENYITIEGGFGYLQLGNKDGVGEQFTPTASDLIGPDGTDDNAPQFYSSTGSLGTQQASLINTIGDENNITYILPSIGGLTVGASFKDAGDGASENADETVVAAKYEFESGAVKGSLTYADNSISGATSGASSTNSSAMGITLSSGPVTFIYAHAEDDQSTTIETEADDYGISYQVNDALTLAVTGTEITESTGGESLDVTSVALSYNITSGLDAYLTYHDYDYKAGTSGATSDDGSATAITLAATF
jgi:hypothetical protein|tara:strand:- start:270 stop:1292 length:1023 start_codon:yes stop_codon:yes gene_type:complete